MAVGGRKPKPTNIRKFEGNREHRPMPKNEPKPGPGVFKCPAWMPTEGKVAWEGLVPKLSALGLCTDIDEHAVQMYCLTYARWRAAETEVDALEAYSTEMGEKGYVQQNPKVVVAQKYFAQLKGMLSEFGMTPSARTRVEAAATGGEDEFGELW